MTYKTNGEQQVPQHTEHIRCAIYARSATTPNPESIEAQIKDCRDAARIRGWAVLKDYVEVDEGKSGNSAAERPGLQKLLALAKNNPRPFDCILCADTSRIARDVALALSIIESLHRCGVHVYSADADLDSRSKRFRSEWWGLENERCKDGVKDFAEFSQRGEANPVKRADVVQRVMRRMHLPVEMTKKRAGTPITAAAGVCCARNSAPFR